MALTIYGKLDPEDKKYIEDLTIRETWTVVATVEGGQEKDEVYFEKGDNALVAAEEFLHVLDAEKYEKFKEIKSHILAREKDAEKGYWIKTEEVQMIYELIKSIPAKWREIFDENDQLRAEKSAFVEQTAPYLIREHYPYSDKNIVVKMIDYSQWQTNQLIKFFALSSRLRREIWLSY